MIDRRTRDVVFEELRKAAIGNGSSFDCEDKLMSMSSDDGVIEALRRTFREMMDEHDKPLKFVFAEGTDMRSRLARWLLFLKSNYSYTWPTSNLPTGILDYYKPTLFDRITGGDKRIINAITHFMQAGDYAYWPFASKSDYEQAKSSTPRKGLRLGTSAELTVKKAQNLPHRRSAELCKPADVNAALRELVRRKDRNDLSQ